MTCSDTTLIYIGTEDGLRVARFTDSDSNDIEIVGQTLAGNAVRSIGVDPRDAERAYIGCGLRGWGLHVTEDAGTTTEPIGFEERWVWGVFLDPSDPKTVYVGTEPPSLSVSHDGGATFERYEELDDLPSRSEWTFFHEPFYAGHVHGIASHEAHPERLFAGIEHGALIYTHDGGRTWHEALTGYDLHRIESDPKDPDRVLAGAGEGLFISDDAGETWEAVSSLRGNYVHGIEFDPRVPDRIYVYVDSAASPLYRSDDNGETWSSIGDPLPTARPADPLAIHPTEPETLLYAGDEEKDTDSESSLFVSRDGGTTWQSLLDGLPKVWRLHAVAETTIRE